MSSVLAERQARYEALVRAVDEPIRRYIHRRTDRDAAEDVAADVLLVLWRRLDDIPDEALPWCYGVARRCLANAERSKRRQRRLIQRIINVASNLPGGDVERIDDRQLNQALRRLPTADREVLRLWAWEDLLPREIAVVLGITANTAAVRLHRAKARLARELTDAHSPRPTSKRAPVGGHIPIDNAEGDR